MALTKTQVIAAASKVQRRSANSDRQGNDGRGSDQDPSTFLVIPYFAGDYGRTGIERPLPASVIAWLCPAIIVNDSPGQNNFKRGEPTKVTVDVGNYGAGTLTAPVYVRVWWSDPATGFTTLNLFGQTTLAVPNGLVKRTSELVAVIPATAPPHVCLLACVWSPLDNGASSPNPDPVNDRHWAQLNLNEIEVPAGQKFQFMFWAGNPTKRDVEIEITAAPLQEESLRFLSRVRRMEHVLTHPAELRLADARDVRSATAERGGASVRLELPPGGRRPMLLAGSLPENAAPRSSAVVEIKSALVSEDGRQTGSIGLIVNCRAG